MALVYRVQQEGSSNMLLKRTVFFTIHSTYSTAVKLHKKISRKSEHDQVVK